MGIVRCHWGMEDGHMRLFVPVDSATTTVVESEYRARVAAAGACGQTHCRCLTASVRLSHYQRTPALSHPRTCAELGWCLFRGMISTKTVSTFWDVLISRQFLCRKLQNEFEHIKFAGLYFLLVWPSCVIHMKLFSLSELSLLSYNFILMS